jgi:post-segregation antitoxin (ccd killing protein)
VVIGGIVAWALWARARGQRAAAWRSRAREPYSEGVVLHDRLKADLGLPQVADDRLDESLTEVDQIGQQLNALTVDAPDDRTQQALAGLLMTLGAVRSALEEVRRAPDQGSRQAAVEPARARVAEFERSLGSFRAAVWPDSTPAA